MSDLYLIWNILWLIFSLWAVIWLLLEKREPASTLSWLLLVVLVPIGGALIFFFFGPQRLIRQAHKRKEEIKQKIASSHYLSMEVPIPDSDAPILKLTREISDYGPTGGNHLTLLLDPDQALIKMQKAIEEAVSFIHLEYYIFSSDEVTEQLFDSLIDAKKRGVEVRILYDSLGSLSLKKLFFNKLAKHDIKIRGFLPLSAAFWRVNLNFRNHRKILIIDGHTAFTGGTNIGSEYLGKISQEQWRDYSVMLNGPACLQLQDVFAKDWQFTTEEDLFQPKYYPTCSSQGGALIQVLESGPDSPFSYLHQAIFLMLTTAKKEINLMTPYFIPDQALKTSLIVASLKGVKVKILLPSKNDSYFVQMASRSFYEDLLWSGIEIHEYQPKILHAKLLTIDDSWTILGSANMDIRSFRLNFELNLLIHGKECSGAAKDFFNKELSDSKLIDLERFQRRSPFQKILENTCRLFSPIL